ncbi:Maf family protein [Bifidobacterium eulemuris]|uniref:Nucleoside triphosphate pyrophosphatase n=1 Tax=Bifidobacterium eulemuris TaxID=1765219 RepID=A0A261G059_9BIFI|nr:Maf family protein [Bifidobacterium eulemuris]OZG64787.1 septum formation inhibitor Maf [Bifidobacterium eulemuris]QOL32529.1 Maf family protein [Bifidobacterium eulemuris]
MSIPLILASKSVPRRNVLNSAGVCPTIRVSHVDEPAALERAAREAGVAVADLSVDQRVMILAEAKAQAVHQAYRDVAATAAAARGERVTGYPLRAAEVAEAGISKNTEHPVISAGPQLDYSNASVATTRDFSGVSIPTETEPISVIVGEQAGLSHNEVGPLILGCDSMFLMNGECYGKPHSVEVARERLRAMRGHTGELWTGHCLIDFATGRVARGASHAKVHFCDYTDDDIERYIATGEPLEVAGSFTLEGFGGAFIDGIEGDPHGIIGLSLPLARRLCAELGVSWTDLWNVGRGVKEPEDKASGVAHAEPAQQSGLGGTPKNAVIIPPKENVHQPGDGWVECACGRKHWGTNGASGILLARRDETSGEVTHVVMQHRAMWSAEGGTWGIPGGATANGENPIEGALRESYEEANITPEDIEVVGAYREDHGPWSYTTVFAFEKPGHRVEPKANDDESMEIEWVPIDDVPNRKLLTAMRTDWPNFAARLRELATQER